MSAPAPTSAPVLRRAALRRRLGRPARVLERIVGGGRLRERLLLAALRMHYRSRFRRDWLWTDDPPHFFAHRVGAFDLAFGSATSGAYPWSRAFSVAEVIRDGDALLDIGCGDGFFTARFFAPRCELVDGLDVDPDAIATARRDNPAANVVYHVADAVERPFPRERYDVVVWNGALGHFAPATTGAMLEKIERALMPDGIFCGSESLGFEGVDHQQFFPDLESLHDLLSVRFTHVWLREVEYRTGTHPRREALWRAAASTTRHEAAGWLSGRRTAT